MSKIPDFTVLTPTSSPENRQTLLAITNRLNEYEPVKVWTSAGPVVEQPSILPISFEEISLDTQPVLVSLSPSSSRAFFRLIGGGAGTRRMVGARDFCAVEFTTNEQMQRSALQQAGVPVASDQSLDDVNLCFWVSGTHMWPVAFCYTELTQLMPQPHLLGVQARLVTPVWSKRIARLADALRLCCSSFNYSGPIFVRVSTEKEALSIWSLSFEYPAGFMSAMCQLFCEQQTLSAWFRALQKGLYVVPDLQEGKTGAAFRSSSSMGATIWQEEVLERGTSGIVQVRVAPPGGVPQEGGPEVVSPEITIRVDLTSQLEYTYAQLERSKFKPWSKATLKLEEVGSRE